MPQLLDGVSRAAVLASAINHVLAEHGPGGVTMRRISRQSGVSQASIAHQMGSKEHLLRVSMGLTAHDRASRMRARIERDVVDALLPRGGDEVVEARSWLGWLEIARFQDGLQLVVQEHRETEVALLSRGTGYRLDRDRIDGLLALSLGLTHGICLAHDPVRVGDARRVLRQHVARVDPGQPEPEPDVTPEPRGGSFW